MRSALLCLYLGGCNHASLALPDDLGRDLTASDLTSTPIDLAGSCIATAVNVSGAIPHGFFDGRWAWAWYSGGDCPEQPHLMLRSDDNASRDPIMVEVQFDVHATTGDQMVLVRYWFDPMMNPIEAQGRANLTHAEPLFSTTEPTLEGTLEVNDNGLSLSGSFSARHCSMFDLFCV